MIESRDNKTFKTLKSLLSSKGIKKEGKCLASGSKIVPELTGETVFYEEGHDHILSKELFKELDVHGTNSPLLLKDLPKVEIWNPEVTPKGVEVLIPAGDPKNLGALIRTCMAFSASKIVLLEESAHPFLPEVIKTSSGSVFKAPLFKGPSIKDLNETNFLYTLDAKGAPLHSCKEKNITLLIGEEGGNIPSTLLKQSLSIEISKNVESLNVNSALSVALYALRG